MKRTGPCSVHFVTLWPASHWLSPDTAPLLSVGGQQALLNGYLNISNTHSPAKLGFSYPWLCNIFGNYSN